MRDRSIQEHLQPALLDRLTDDEPTSQQESREKRIISLRRLRECVLRDLAWLLNTGNLQSVEDLDAHEEVASSVVNYGIPEFAGASASNIDAMAMEKGLALAIRRFEPRIIPKSLRLKVRYDEANEDTHNSVTFDIEGELYAQPAPIRMMMKTEVDLETGNISVTEEFG